MNKKYCILSFAFAFVLQTHAQQDDMRETVEYLASQELGGRYPATAGDTLASEFIASKLRQLKLKPVVKEKRNKGFYNDFTYGKDVQRTTHNIIAVLPGKDKHLKHEYIVVGSHYDHLGMGGQGSGSRRPDTLGVHPVLTIMPAVMRWYWNWLSILRRPVHHAVLSSLSLVQRNRVLWAPNIF